MKIAIVGGGIAGLSCARLLHQQNEVIVYDKNNYIGGHSNTVQLDFPSSKPVFVDTGFIVFNKKNYPFFSTMLEELGVESYKSDMSFGVSLQAGKIDLEYSSDMPWGLFANLFNLVRPRYWSFLREIIRFNKTAKQDLIMGLDDEESLDQYIKRNQFSDFFVTSYLIPMGAAIWSAPFQNILNFPVLFFLQFLYNHGLLSIHNRPQWYTVQGGSQQYVQKLIKPFQKNIKFQKVNLIERLDTQVLITSLTGSGQTVQEFYDQVIVATHADEALALLRNPTDAEKDILGSFSYQENKTYLHQDKSLMPNRNRAWASWNAILHNNFKEDTTPVCVSYWMNKLQNLPSKRNFFVTLNPSYVPKNTLREFTYHHPIYDKKAVFAQKNLHKIQGNNHTWFCGSYFGHGFHEDALVSGIQVASALGCPLNWKGSEVVRA